MADTTTAGLTGALILGALTFKTIDLIKYAIALSKHWEISSQQQRQDPSSMTDEEKKAARKEAEDRDAAQKTHDEAFNGLITLLIGCVAGVCIVLLFAETGLAGDVKVGDTALTDLTFASKIALGLAMTSVAGVLFDAKKAVDSSDSASKPKITKPAERARQEMLNKSQAAGSG